jgi:hypothetical protein
MQIVDETKYPHLYIVSYALGHGESIAEALPYNDYTDAQLQEMDDFLAGRTLRELNTYIGPQDQVPLAWEEIHRFMVKAGMARG